MLVCTHMQVVKNGLFQLVVTTDSLKLYLENVKTDFTVMSNGDLSQK